MIWLLFALMLGTMLLGVPILLSIALVGYVGIAAIPDLVLPMVVQKMFAQLDSFTLLALPYFILAGCLFSASGLSQQLVEFSRVLVGHLRAGLAHASVVASMVFAGVSGSSTADASAIAAIVIPTMKKEGYKAGFAAALIATAGTIGAIIPPSMIMVVYGSIAQVSIGGLFLAGIIPGLLVGLALMATIKVFSGLPAYPELRVVHGRFEPRAVLRSLRVVWPALLGPVIIVGGILSGIFTATEAGAVACLYALVVGMLFSRKIRFRDLPKILVEATVMTTMVSGIIAVAGASGWLLGYLEFNQGVVRFTTSLSKDPTLILLILAVAMIVLGTFVDSLAVLLVFAPAAIEVSKAYGIDPFQMGLVMVMCNQIGSVSPPTAPLLFITSGIAQATYMDVNRHVWWFMLAETLVMLLVIFVPGIASWIPRYYGF
ncbi:MAG: TRAP transporter large permease [Burkholderiaceae bacterium]|nr:TRAP transporter large permease [Burkholderiaceae bacterium]